MLIVAFCKYISHLIESDTILGKTAEVVNDLLCWSTYEVIWEAYRTQKSVRWDKRTRNLRDSGAERRRKKHLYQADVKDINAKLREDLL